MIIVITRNSLKTNMVFNMIKGIMGVIMPLITFPYISRTLGVENVGKVSFVNSVISYFGLLAALGIRMYTVSAGSKYRNDHEKMNRFANSVFTINVIFTVNAYVLLFLLVATIPKFQEYMVLFAILSLQIILTTIGVDWINVIYEDYFYITVRTILFNLLQLILLFLFVRTEGDLIKYMVISVFCSNGLNLINHFYVKKYCRPHLTVHVDWELHMKPILLLFATQAMITIYVSSDTTILGFLCGDVPVGIYHVSVKIYTIVKTVAASMVAVSIPRLSNLYSRGKREEFSATAQDTYYTMLTICIPAMLGLLLLRREIIELISGPEYVKAVYSLAILSIAMFFCIGAYFWGQAILVSVGQERILLKVTVLSAAVNIVFNFMLIPYWKENAAAFTTLIAEMLTFAICRYYGKQYVQFTGCIRIWAKIFCGCMGIIVIKALLTAVGLTGIWYVIFMILCSAAVYFLIEIIVNNEVLKSMVPKSYFKNSSKDNWTK